MSEALDLIKKELTDGNFLFLSFPYVLITAFVLYLICLLLFFRRKSVGKNICLLLLFLYIGMLFSLTIPVVPPKYQHITSASTEWAIHSIEWIPFLSAANIFQNASSSGNWKEFLRVIGGNFVVLMPLAILIPLINSKFRLGRMLLLAILIPVCIEGLQLLGNILSGSVIRTVEVEDVILNASGCILAYLVFTGFRRLSTPKHAAKHYRKC